MEGVASVLLPPLWVCGGPKVAVDLFGQLEKLDKDLRRIKISLKTSHIAMSGHYTTCDTFREQCSISMQIFSNMCKFYFWSTLSCNYTGRRLQEVLFLLNQVDIAQTTTTC